MDPMTFTLRLITYSFTWLSYILYMSIYAPLGSGWLSWHSQRIFNAVEYLKLNGYFSSYGFTIWTKCQDCSLIATEWVDKLYLSVHLIPFTPYIIINHFWGKETLAIYGPFIDKLIIFLIGILIVEFMVKWIKSYSRLPIYLISTACFLFYISSPWTYKMIIASWFEVYFLFFLLLSFFCFDNYHKKLGFVFLFVAGLYSYQWVFAIAIFYVLIKIVPHLIRDNFKTELYFPPNNGKQYQHLSIILCLLLPVILLFILRYMASSHLTDAASSSLLFRIGITGNDIHNGGILGALQFFGGNRITQCFQPNNLIVATSDLNQSIASYNCIFSITGMSLLSVLSIAGLCLLTIKSISSRSLVLPICFSLIVFVSFLQQSLSVHLMGYSFIFSILFATGLTNMIIHCSNYITSRSLATIFTIPLIAGIVILSIHVSMLTGVNG